MFKIRNLKCVFGVLGYEKTSKEHKKIHQAGKSSDSPAVFRFKGERKINF